MSNVENCKPDRRDADTLLLPLQGEIVALECTFGVSCGVATPGISFTSPASGRWGWRSGVLTKAQAVALRDFINEKLPLMKDRGSPKQK